MYIYPITANKKTQPQLTVSLLFVLTKLKKKLTEFCPPINKHTITTERYSLIKPMLHHQSQYDNKQQTHACIYKTRYFEMTKAAASMQFVIL